MSRSTIRADDAAVVVVDCQNDLVHESRAEQRGVSGSLARAVRAHGILPRMRALLAAARGARTPILYTTVENRPELPPPDYPLHRWSKGQRILRPGTWGAEIHAEIAPEAADLVLPRSVGIDPAYGSALWPTLDTLARRTLIVLGVATNFAVEGTVRAAANRGFGVHVVADCCASHEDGWHRFTIEHILPLIATVARAEDVVAALGGSGGRV